MTKVMRKEARHMQRRDRASGVPLDILEHLPLKKPESAYFIALCSHLFRQMSGQVSRGSAGEYQADEQAGVAGLSSRVSG